MNRARVAALYRQIGSLFVDLADELEAEDAPRPRRPKLAAVPPPVDELARAEAKGILKRKGLLR